MNKEVLAYGFHKFSQGLVNDDGTVNIGPTYPNFQPLPEWYELLLAIKFDPSMTVSSLPNRTCGHLGIRTSNGKCYQCTIDRDRQHEEQRRARESTKQVDEVRAAQIRARREELMKEYVALGKELIAVTDVSVPAVSRQQALVTGARWYIPDTPCRRCGQLAPRYVANGRCKSCG